MSKYIFVGRVSDNEYDRDCCFYVEEKEHRNIANEIILHGANYCGFYEEKIKAIEEGNVESYLSQEELIDFLNGNNYDFYIEKLQSEEAKEFQARIIEEEKEYVMDEYYLSREDVDCIFEEYYLDYQDRGIVCRIYDDVEDLGYEEFDSLVGFAENISIVEKYFDFKAFGEDLIYDSECYIELPSGKCAQLSY